MSRAEAGVTLPLEPTFLGPSVCPQHLHFPGHSAPVTPSSPLHPPSIGRPWDSPPACPCRPAATALRQPEAPAVEGQSRPEVLQPLTCQVVPAETLLLINPLLLQTPPSGLWFSPRLPSSGPRLLSQPHLLLIHKGVPIQRGFCAPIT